MKAKLYNESNMVGKKVSENPLSTIAASLKVSANKPEHSVLSIIIVRCLLLYQTVVWNTINESTCTRHSVGKIIDHQCLKY